jgi:hypothetical protein
VVTVEFIDRIAQIESGNNPKAVGKHGEHTAYQMKQCFVDDVCKYFGWRRRLITSLTPGEARAFAQAGCLMLESRMRRFGCPNPTQEQIYRAYSLGLKGYHRQTSLAMVLHGPAPTRQTSTRGQRVEQFP